MKKLILGLALSYCALNIQAQELADKKTQLGFLAGLECNFQKMGTDRIQSNGIGSDFMIGINATIALNNNLAFNTGLEFDLESLKYKSGPNSLYYSYKDENILRLNENSELINSINNIDSVGANNYFRLDQRKQEIIYLTVPTMLVFRTNFFGYVRCFGKLGIKTSFVLSNKNTDIGSTLGFNGISIIEGERSNHIMKSKGEVFIIKSAIGFSGGVEWNFIGKTSLIGEIGYFYGFTPLYTRRSFFADTTGNVFANNATQNQLQLKASILF